MNPFMEARSGTLPTDSFRWSRRNGNTAGENQGDESARPEKRSDAG